MGVDAANDGAKGLFEGGAVGLFGLDGLPECGFGSDLCGDGAVEVGLRGGKERDIGGDESTRQKAAVISLDSTYNCLIPPCTIKKLKKSRSG